LTRAAIFLFDYSSSQGWMLPQSIDGQWWLIPIVLVTWEVEIGRIIFQGQPGQIVHKTPSPKYQKKNGLEVWLKQ
jgi:hypothetical protein